MRPEYNRAGRPFVGGPEVKPASLTTAFGWSDPLARDWQNHAEPFLGLTCQLFGDKLGTAFKTAKSLTDVPAQKLRP